ncbi:MAG: DUF4402 domain-containing protein [Sphingomonadales bacterium]|nr:DUF4402 domain-containing protein [Sphingomonadales bacterium]
MATLLRAALCSANPVPAASDSFDILVSIRQPVALTKTADLICGDFVTGTADSIFRLNRGGGANMRLRSLTLQADNLISLNFPGLFRIASANVITLRIGGTLDVQANQQAGVYQGSFPITLNYY